MKYGIFTYLDLFSLPILLYFGGHTKRASGLGIASSIGIYIFLIYSFLSSDFFFKKNPIVVVESQQISHAERISFSEKMLISVGLQDSANNKFLDDTIFSIRFKYSLNATYSNFLKLSPCTPQDVWGDENLYAELGLHNNLCLQNKTLALEGSWEESHVEFFTTNIVPCDNVTMKGKCKTPQEIFDFFHDPFLTKFLHVTYHSAKINLEDYEHPMKINYKRDYVAVDTQMRKRVNIYLKNAYVETDEGAIFYSGEVKSDLVFHTKEYDFQLRVNQVEPMAHFFFYSTREEIRCKRRYQKLPEVLASLTGMLYSIMYLCRLLSHLVNYVSTLEYVLNKLYIFPKISSSKKRKDGPEKTEVKAQTSRVETEATIHTKNNKTQIETQIQPTIKPKSECLIEENSKTLRSTQMDKRRVDQKFLKQDSFVMEHYSSRNFDSKERMVSIVPIPNTQNFISEKATSKFKRVLRFKKKPPQLDKTNKINHNLNRLKSLLKKRPTLFHSLANTDLPSAKNRFSLSFSGYLWYLFRQLFCLKKSNKQKLISKAEETFRKDLDILNIMTKLHDLERLKILLLNEDQLLLFNYLSKPLITFESDSLMESENLSLSPSQLRMSRLMNSLQKPEKDLENSYSRVQADSEGDKINCRLIELFDRRVWSYKKEDCKF